MLDFWIESRQDLMAVIQELGFLLFSPMRLKGFPLKNMCRMKSGLRIWKDRGTGRVL